MIRSINKRRKIRKAHFCEACGSLIPVGTVCIWYKSVAFGDSDIGRNEWYEAYICHECENEWYKNGSENINATK